MEWAIVFLAVVIALIFRPKGTLWTLGVLVVVVGLIVGVGALMDHYEREKREADKRAIKMSVVYAPERCGNERTEVEDNGKWKTVSVGDLFPLEHTITNTSDKVLMKVSWRLGVYDQGRSTNLVENPYSDTFDSDRILKSGESIKLCFGIPKLNSNPFLDVLKPEMVYKVEEIVSVTYQEVP